MILILIRNIFQSYYFARDDRVYKAFVDRLSLYKVDINRTCSRQLKEQLQILRSGLEGRLLTYRVRQFRCLPPWKAMLNAELLHVQRKVELLANQLDA